ncbi:MAG: ABC transporter ATP-binding protein [Rhodomicrobiaceae bacterium]
MTNILEVEDLRAFYGPVEALHGIDFSIPEGGVAALLGANGAGKTTTLRAISGIIHATGSIRIDGRSVIGCQPEIIARLGVAHVPEGRGTFSGLTVGENLRLGAITRSDPKAIASDIERCFGYFPILQTRYHQQAGTLSGGEQQMLAVARALMLRPRLMLLDEPSFGLAPMVVRDLFDILCRINRAEQVSMLIVEQNTGLALDLAGEAYLLETGRLVLSGPSSRIGADESVRRSYLGY